MLSVDGEADAAVETRIQIVWNKIRQLVPLLTSRDISLIRRGSCQVHKERLLLLVQCVQDAPRPTVAAPQGKETRDQADTSLPNSAW